MLKKDTFTAVLSPELKLLIACCQVQPDLDEIRSSLSTINYSLFTSMAMRHGVLPLVYKTLKEVDGKMAARENEDKEAPKPSTTRSSLNTQRSTLNAEMLPELKAHYMRISQRNMLMTAELLRIMKLLEKKGIEALAFKGPVLSQMAYGDITLRQYGDLDILVHRKDFRLIADMMIARGYEARYPIDTYEGDKVLFELNNDCPFYDRGKGLAVELHWDFFRKLALPTEKFFPWKDQTTVSINQHPVHTLSPESHLLYLALHGAKHIYERLIWIVDIDRFVRTHPEIDWLHTLKMAKDIGAEKMLLFSIALSRAYFHTPVPEFLAERTEPSHFQGFIAFVNDEFHREDPTPEDSLTKLRKVIALRDTLYYKVLTVAEFVFRPGINERRMVVLSDRWFWLYWLLRPLGMGYRFLFCRLLKICSEPDRSV